MTVPEPAPCPDDLRVEVSGVAPPVGPEELTQGYGLTEFGADCECGCGGGLEALL
ncbi:hypothetical protein IOD16_13080 [Saccharothrix sp. 6-C]|uniref:hypothetical protein n=1 Tax=Saccharothrix sp. 6-C TaxID=2781735 RepID=UPI00191764CB|nr:hypothetical protein [Saccharothrix sp. 6-C]QQQ79269.1 hypothetical protein IOD16_13080 [Saccharothrix sp. 6-C]